MAWSKQPGKMSFGYDAIVDKSRRKAPPTAPRHESKIVSQTDRRKLNATTQDQRRNLSLVAWAYRMHLAFNTQFRLHVTTKDEGLNEAIEDAFEWWALPTNCDVTNRHSLRRLCRLAEGHRFLDGDVGVLFTPDGRLQLIEGDRINNPSQGVPKKYQGINWNQGVELDRNGGAIQYMLCQRVNGGGSLAFDSVKTARNLKLYGYFERYDQHRGISPLSAAINTFQDVYETWELNVLKAKAHALFGMVISRESSGRGELGMEQTETLTATDDDATQFAAERYETTPEGIFKMELAMGENVSTIESKTPSDELVNFTKLLSRAGFLAMDLPYSFFDSSDASYSAQRMDLILYEIGNAVKREPMQNLLQLIAKWKLSRWTRNDPREMGDSEPRIVLPRGIELENLTYEWVPQGIPWVDPAKESKADEAAIRNGLVSRTYIAKKRNLPRLRQTFDELEREESEISRRGITIQAADPGAETINNIEADSADGAVPAITKAG